VERLPGGQLLRRPYTQAQLPNTYDGNFFSHDAFRKVGRYYIDWYESGVQPAISKDLIAIAHRPHTENGASLTGTMDSVGLPRQTDYSVVEERLYAVVLLKSPGEVRLTSGGATQTFSQPAGASEVSMPFASGTQKIDLLRSGATQVSATSPIQVTTSPVALFNYNVATSHAEGL
jgi:glucan endo-1,3-alpha-glucosidase